MARFNPSIGAAFPKSRKAYVSEAEQTALMDDTELRQFALLQLETLTHEINHPRLWAAIYAIQAMDNGPMPADYLLVITEAAYLDQDV